MKSKRLSSASTRLLIRKTDYVSYIFKFQIKMLENCIQIRWYEKNGQINGHGEYLTRYEFQELNNGKTPEELIEELNNQYPDIHHYIQEEPYIAS